MPTYQYACTACGEQSEAVQAFSDAPLTECSACGGRLRKVFSAVGVVFKGSGFYKTDSRTGTKTDAAASGDKGPGDKGSGEKVSSGKAASDSGGSAPAAKNDAGSSGSHGGTAATRPAGAPATKTA